MLFLLIPCFLNIEDSRRHQEQNKHDDRHCETDHKGITAFHRERFSPVLHLFYDPAGSHDPSDQESREQGDKGHHNTVADIVHQIQELADASVGERQFQIKKAVSERNDD